MTSENKILSHKISKYRGDTFDFPFTTLNDVVIGAGSTIKAGIRSTEEGAEYSLFLEFTIETDTTEIYFEFPAEETAKLEPSDELELYGAAYVLEVEVTASDGYVITAFQEEIEVRRDYVHE